MKRPCAHYVIRYVSRGAFFSPSPLTCLFARPCGVSLNRTDELEPPRETARVGKRPLPLLIRVYIQSWFFLASCSPLRCRVLDRPPGSDNGETDDLPPESLSRMPPHNGLTNGWAESSSMVSERRGWRVWATMDQMICHLSRLPHRWIVSQHNRRGSRVHTTGQRAISCLGLSRLPRRRMALRHKRRGPRRRHCHTWTTRETCRRTTVLRWGRWLHPRPTGFLETH